MERSLLHPWQRMQTCALLADQVCLGREATIENLQKNKSSIQIGSHSCCRGRLLVYGHAGRILIGEWSYVGVRTEIWSMQSIEIGNRVLISHDCNIHDGNGHSLDREERHNHFRRIMEQGHPQTSAEMPGVRSDGIVIEDDVWISFGVTILKGVRIGAGSVIAAGSIVTQDVPPGVLYRHAVVPILQPLP